MQGSRHEMVQTADLDIFFSSLSLELVVVEGFFCVIYSVYCFVWGWCLWYCVCAHAGRLRGAAGQRGGQQSDVPGRRGELGRRLRAEEQARSLHPCHQLAGLDQRADGPLGTRAALPGCRLLLCDTGWSWWALSFAPASTVNLSPPSTSPQASGTPRGAEGLV